MPASATGFLHLSAALVALTAGTVVALARKGTRQHVAAGRLYLAGMASMNISALGIFRISGDFGPFHAGALLSLATLMIGWGAIRSDLRSRVALHGYCMLWSYLGLVAAAVSEVATHMLGWPPSAGVAGTSLAVFVVGGWIVHTRAAGTIHRVAVARRGPGA